MKITLLYDNTHLTITEKNSIKTMIEKGWKTAETKKKRYFLKKIEDSEDEYLVKISTYDVYTIGRKAEWRDDIVKIKVN